MRELNPPYSCVTDTCHKPTRRTDQNSRYLRSYELTQSYIIHSASLTRTFFAAGLLVPTYHDYYFFKLLLFIYLMYILYQKFFNFSSCTFISKSTIFWYNTLSKKIGILRVGLEPTVFRLSDECINLLCYLSVRTGLDSNQRKWSCGPLPSL